MGRHRVPGEKPITRLSRPLVTALPVGNAGPGTAPPPTSRRGARRGGSVRSLVSQPWLTLVLLALVVGVGASVLRPDTYAATAVITATTDRAASAGAVELTRRDVVPRVAQAIELDGGRFRLAVDHPAGRPELLVTAQAEDPRLAALAADTAAALVVSERREHMTLSGPAPVPTEPVDGPSPWWAAVGLTALALALLAERAHGRWELRHTPLRHAEAPE